jgi:hypothetical protein
MTQLYTTDYVLLPRTKRGVEELNDEDDSGDNEVKRNGKS